MSTTVPNYRWSPSEFVRAWQAGSFDHRVEMIDGELWPVVIGRWHGKTVGEIIAVLERWPGEVTTATRPSGESPPYPDGWVLREAESVDTLGAKLELWAPADVLLVVEVSDETLLADLPVKANIYGAAGWSVYRAVPQDAIYEHTEPTPVGYRTRIECRRGDRLPIRYAGTDILVDDLLGRLSGDYSSPADP